MCLAPSGREGEKKSSLDVTTSGFMIPNYITSDLKRKKKNLKRIQFEVVSVGFAFLTLNPTQKIFKENKLTTKLKIHIETRHYL